MEIRACLLPILLVLQIEAGSETRNQNLFLVANEKIAADFAFSTP
jgi:hypothetical protein